MENKEQVFTVSLRNTLKLVMQNEIERLPEVLEGLEAKERINILCKIMPFVFPKVEAVHLNEGEPYKFN
jgi:hypothetical protein